MADSSINEIKTIIRGLLISTPEELTVLKLRRDFKAQEGREIPFFEFGFRDITSFLRSIPDVCKITPNANGPYAIVSVVESEKSAHVSSLVLRQKTIRGRRRQSCLSSRVKPSRVLYRPKNCRTFKLKHESTSHSQNDYFDSNGNQFSNGVETFGNANKVSELSEYFPSNSEETSGIANKVSGSSEYCPSKSEEMFRNDNVPVSYQYYPLESEETFRNAKKLPESSHYNVLLSDVTSRHTCEGSESSQYNPSYPSFNSFSEGEILHFPNNEESKILQEDNHYVPDRPENELTELQTFINFYLRDILRSDKGVSIKDIQEYVKDALSMYGIDTSDDLELILKRIPYICIDNGYVYNMKYVRSYQAKLHEELKDDVNLEITSSDTDEVLASEDAYNICEKEDISAKACTFVPQSSNEKIQRLERNLNSLMKDHKNGILGSELKDKYKMKFAAPLNLPYLGYESTEDLILKMPHIFSYVVLENRDYKIYPCAHHTGRKLKELTADFLESNNESVVPVITQRNVEWMMRGYPNGLNFKDFEQVYKDTFLANIELKQMGLSSVEEFVKCLEAVNVLKIQITAPDTWLFPTEKSANVSSNDLPLPLQEQIDIETLKEKFPPDVVGPDVHVKQVEIPSWMEKNSFIEIFVQEVNNPHNFWITFCGEQYNRALDSLMDDLQAFYCSKSHNYRMPPECIREGQDCVTQYVEEWHRARIISIISASEVEVCFYDYGTKRIVSKNNIHYLHTAHSSLPAQAVNAVLANIDPVGDRWTQEASKRFLQLIANKPLIGIVIQVDRENSVFYLFLCDTSDSDKDVYIHELLTSEGHAVEVRLDQKGNELQNKTNIVESLEQKSSLALEEKRHMQSEVNSLERVCKEEKHPRMSTPGDQISQKNITPHSDAILELQSQNSSRKSSHSSIPCTVESNFQLQSISTQASSSGATSGSSAGVSLGTKTIGISEGLHCQIAPPPGFSQVPKCAVESDVCDQANIHKFCNKDKKLEAVIEISKVRSKPVTNDLKEKRESPEVTFKKIGCSVPTKGVNSGVNANFSNGEKSSYLQNSYSYSNWAPAPPTYSNFPAYPASSIPSMNALAPLSVSPFPLPSIPNPLEYCNMWYYEHWKQQVYLQGMLAHQQMANAAFSPFPPGMFFPPTYTPLNSQSSSQNQMNILEVHSPEPSHVPRTNSQESSPILCTEGISAATQTEVAPINGDSGENSESPRNRPSERNSECTVSKNSCARIDEDSVGSYDQISNNDSHKGSETRQTSDNNYDSFSPETSVAAVDEVLSEEVIAGDGAGKNLQSSYVQTVERENLEFSESNTSVNLIKSSSKNTIVDELQPVVNKTPVIQNSCSIYDYTNLCNSQDKLKKDMCSSAESICIEKSDAHVKLSYRCPEEVNDPQIQRNDELAGNELYGLQVLRHTEPGENGLVLHSRVHDLHNHVRVKNNKDGNEQISLVKVNNHSVLENGCGVVEDQKLAEELSTDSHCKEESDLNDDFFHEQEMIEKSQPQFIAQTCVKNMGSDSNPSALTEQCKFVTREGKVSIKVEESNKYNNELSNNVQTSIKKVFRFGSDEKHQYENNENNEVRMKKLEGIADNLFSGINNLSSPQCSNGGSSNIGHSYRDVLEKTLPAADILCPEFGSLSVSDQKYSSHTTSLEHQYASNSNQLHLNSQVLEIDDVLASRSEKSTVCKKQRNPFKRVRPVLGAKLSNEVSASFTSGPVQPAMTQKTNSFPSTGKSTVEKNNGSGSLHSSQPGCWKTTWNAEELDRTRCQGDPDRLKNLTSGTSHRNPLKPTTLNRHQEDHIPCMKPGTTRPFVKKITLSDKIVHQINLDGRPYVFTDEVVNYFTPFNGRHVILKILEARKVEINFLELSRRRRPEFFECLDKSDIIFLSRGPTGNVIGSIHIVPLRSLPYMLRALNKEDETLAKNVQEEMEKFDPCDPYWTGSFNKA